MARITRCQLAITHGSALSLPSMRWPICPDQCSIAMSKASSTIAREAYFLEFATRIQPMVRVPLLVTGGFRSRASMEAALASREVDLIGLGPPLCYDPDYCNRLLSGEVDLLFSPGEAFTFEPEEAKGMNEMELRWAEVTVATAYHFNQIRRLATGKETEKEIHWQEQLERNKTLEAKAEARYRAAYSGKRNEP